MAYTFVAASSQSMNTSTTPVTAAPLTLHVFAYGNDKTTDQHMLGVYDTATQTNYFAMYINGTNGNNPIGFQSRSTAAGIAEASALPDYPSDTWFAATAVEASTASRTVYRDSTNSGSNTTSVTPGGVDLVSIGASRRTTVVAFMNGQLAEAAIWSAALTTAEINSLWRGFKPRRIRPQSLVFYAPLIRVAIDIRGGLALTVTNSPTVSAHPRVY